MYTLINGIMLDGIGINLTGLSGMMDLIVFISMCIYFPSICCVDDLLEFMQILIHHILLVYLVSGGIDMK